MTLDPLAHRPDGPDDSSNREPAGSGQLRAEVERSLADYLDRRRAESAALAPDFAAAVDVLVRFVRGGGKRVRPTFAWWGWRGAGGDPAAPEAASVVRAVSAIELIHAGALVHDDLIDASSTRRGAPTVHVEFAGLHADAGWSGPPARFGAAAAILLGDLALTWADDLFHEALRPGPEQPGLPAPAVLAAAEPWQAMRTEVLGGQYLDVFTQASGDDSVEAALRIDRFKTAAYTVERPLQLGAALAAAPPPLVRAYRRFGTDIGVAFQLRDDLLGVLGDPDVTGKPAGDDLREGKRTLLLALALHRAGDSARQIILDGLGDPDLAPADVERICGIFHDVGAVAAVEQRIAALTGSALDALTAAEIAEPAATVLADLAVQATRRHR